MTAETAWQIFDAGSFDETTSQVSREAYKSALRKAIGERIKELEDSLDNLPPHLAQNRRIQIYELKSIRDFLMDTVTPE